MVKVFVAQTHERDRTPLCDFLKAAGYETIPYSTHMLSLTSLSRDLMFSTTPSVVVTSQRDLIGCDYISNILHTVALNSPAKTLTIVYSRAVGNLGTGHFVTLMEGTPKHQLKFVPKVSSNANGLEHAKVLEYINDFAPLNKP